MLGRRRLRGLAMVALAGLVGAACTSGDGGSLSGRGGDLRPEVDIGDAVLASLTRLESCGEVEDLIHESLTTSLQQGGLFYAGGEFFGGAVGRDDFASLDFDGATSGRTTSGDAAPVAAPQEATAGDAVGGSGGGSDVYSTTNVQEEGVDEPDRIETDGTYLYVARNGVIHILTVDGLAEVATIDTTGADGKLATWSNDMMLAGDRLIVLGQTDQPVTLFERGDTAGSEDAERLSELSELSDEGDFVGYQPRTVVSRFDVSDPTSPTLVDRVVVDGRLVSARLAQGVARVVTVDDGASGVPVPEPLADATTEEWTEQATAAIEATSAGDLLPGYVTLDGDDQVTDYGTAVGCDAVYTPAYETGPSTLTVHTLDADGPYRPDASVSVLAGGETLYASTDRLYVATTRWWNGPIALGGGSVGIAVPEVVEVVEDEAADELAAREAEAEPIAPDDPLFDPPAEPEPDPTEPKPEPDPGTEPEPEPGPDETPSEPPPPVDAPEPIVPPEEAPSITTELHAFDIAGDGGAAYIGSGQVRGTVLNQFSMSEHERVLRVATTDDAFGVTGGDSESFVTTFREEGDELVQLGQVGELGRGERIFAVRFIGETAYVVTFRQVDPLYTVDLSDPAAPRVLGELKITGYSAYLHPTEPGRLLGLGQEASLEGQRLGTQMSLFDVSDLASPDRLSQVLFGQGTDSQAEYDHHAFLWWAPARRIVVPLTQYGFDSAAGRDEVFSGAVVVELDGDTLREVGRITHSDLVDGDDLPGQFAEEIAYFGGIERSVVVGDRLITVSQLGIAAHDLETLERQGFHRLPGFDE